MPDNNPALRSVIATLATGIFNYQFTSTFQVGGRSVEHGACLTELDDSDKLEIAGRDLIRAQSVMTLAMDLVGAAYKQGDSVVLDGDPKWQIRNWKVSPDGATVTFLLIDGE